MRGGSAHRARIHVRRQRLHHGCETVHRPEEPIRRPTHRRMYGQKHDSHGSTVSLSRSVENSVQTIGAVELDVSIRPASVRGPAARSVATPSSRCNATRSKHGDASGRSRTSSTADCPIASPSHTTATSGSAVRRRIPASSAWPQARRGRPHRTGTVSTNRPSFNETRSRARRSSASRPFDSHADLGQGVDVGRLDIGAGGKQLPRAAAVGGAVEETALGPGEPDAPRCELQRASARGGADSQWRPTERNRETAPRSVHERRPPRSRAPERAEERRDARDGAERVAEQKAALPSHDVHDRAGERVFGPLDLALARHDGAQPTGETSARSPTRATTRGSPRAERRNAAGEVCSEGSRTAGDTRTVPHATDTRASVSTRRRLTPARLPEREPRRKRRPFFERRAESVRSARGNRES